MHILLIRFSSLGDIVLQTPIISWIKFLYPKAKISFLTSKEFTSLVEGHPHIDNVLAYTRSQGLKDIHGLRVLAKEIKNKTKPDFIIDLHGTTRAMLIRRLCLSIPSLVIDKRSFKRLLLIKFKIDLLKNLESHHERIINDLSFLFGQSFERKKLESFLSQQTSLSNGAITSTPDSFRRSTLSNDLIRYIVISPVASFKPKRWPIEKFNELCQRLLTLESLQDYSIKIIGGPDDEYCQRIQSNSSRIQNLQGKTSLAESVEIISESTLCITNDTGMSHIAEAHGVKVISIFGPTSESFGFRPHLKSSIAVSANLSCRPCSGTGSKSCIKPSHECMEAVTVDQIISSVELSLSEAVTP